MARIAFILLCHKGPGAIIRQAGKLTAAGDYIAIHFDAHSPQADFEEIFEGLADNPNVVFVNKRIKCGWGEWSLVQATINTVEAAVDAFPQASHFYMVSGDCMAIKSASFAHNFLDKEDVDYIESFDYFRSEWIKTGFRDERLIYRHWFNERTQKNLFYWSFWTQQRLGLKRRVPADLQIMIGSQWWCLRRRTIEAILKFTRKRRDVMRFFKTTWIPDETFFQTAVRHLIPREEINSRTLTFLMFTDYGMPVTFYNDHYDLLLGQDALFARKISQGASELKERLGEVYSSDRNDFAITDEGRNLFTFISGRGRIGRRFGPRFWENEASLGRDRELFIVTCKKWHVAKRLLEGVRQHSNVPAVAYLFNEENTDLPDLGGAEDSLAKRTRHRRALMRMLFEHHERNQLLICLDTANLDLIQDFYSDRSQTRLLEVDCNFSDEYLIGHARRVGLAGDQTAQDVVERLLPTIRNDVAFESDQIRDAGFANHFVLRENGSDVDNIAALQGFMKVSDEAAKALAETPHLFSD
jgi:hypothetical protein